MAKRKKKKKKSKKTKKTKRKKSKKIVRSRKKSRKVKKTRKSKLKRRKKSKSKTRKVKPRKFIFKAPKLLEDGDGKSLIKVSDSWANHAYVNESKYKKKYKLSIKDNDKFLLIFLLASTPPATINWKFSSFVFSLNISTAILVFL